MKYGRFIKRADNSTQLSDVIDLGAPPFNQRPLLGCDNDEDILGRLFAPELVTEWKANNVWFTPVLAGVQDSATFTGTDASDPDNYLNPDGTNGNGEVKP